MWRILRVINENVAEGPATVRLPASVPSPAGYRGPVVLDPTHCLGCGICAYVCVTDAITGSEDSSGCVWAYEPGRCTFCARCLERCPGAALTMTPEPLPAYTQLGELSVRHLVPFPACPDCGAPVRPVNKDLIRRLFEEVKEDTWELMRRCERCRRRRFQRGLLAAVSGENEEKAL